jgi:hypothetical protein
VLCAVAMAGDTTCQNTMSGGGDRGSASVLSVTTPNPSDLQKNLKSSQTAAVCEDIGQRGECCLACEMPRYQTKEGVAKKVCDCVYDRVKFRYSSPFPNYLYPCFPKKVLLPSDVLFGWAGNFIQYCIERGCVCVDVLQEKKPLVLYPGSFPPTGPLASAAYIKQMFKFMKKLKASKSIKKERKEQILGLLRFLRGNIYRNISLRNTKKKNTLKKYIKQLLEHKLQAQNNRKTIPAKAGSKLAKLYNIYYDTILAEIYRTRAYLINQYRAAYPGDNSYYIRSA